MTELDWNNNSDAIDAALADAKVRPAEPVDESPTQTGPFPTTPIMQRLASLEERVTILEGGSE